MANSFHHSHIEFIDCDISDIHTTLWGFVIHVSAAEIESEALQKLYLNSNYLPALVQHLKVSSIKKISHADLGEELVHKTSR